MADAGTCALHERLALALRAAEGGAAAADHDGFGWLEQKPDIRPAKLTSAAVLMPIVARPEGATVLLTRRAPDLANHAGQVSFPGGKIDPDDASAEDAALRETEEEIGLARDRIEVLGQLGDRVTGSGYRVTPVLGLVRPPFPLAPASAEVETVFEVPLSFVLDRGNHRTETRYQKGLERVFYVLPYGEFYIWGLTARLLVALCNILDPP